MGLPIYNTLAILISDNLHLFPPQLPKGRIYYRERYTTCILIICGQFMHQISRVTYISFMLKDSLA